MLLPESLHSQSTLLYAEGQLPSNDSHDGYVMLATTESFDKHHMETNNSTLIDEKVFTVGPISYHGIILASVTVIGILSNIFIVAIILLNRKLRGSMSNILLCHLCAIALVNCTILLPVYLGVAFSMEWYAHPMVCALQGTLTTFLSSATLLNLTAISVDKYRTIASPLKYSTRLDKSRLAVTCTIIWVPSVMLCILPLAVGPGYSYHPAEAKCDLALLAPKQSIMVRWGVSMPLILIMFYIPSSIIVGCYTRIFCIARSHRKRIIAMLALVMLSFQAPITRNEGARAIPPNEQKASRTIAVFLGTFFIFYIPYSFLSLIQLIFNLQVNFYIALGIHVVHQCAPCINGIVYGSMNKSLRQSLSGYTRKLYSRHFLLNRLQSQEIRAIRNGELWNNNATRV